MDVRAWSIRRRLLALALATAVPMVLASAFSYYGGRAMQSEVDQLATGPIPVAMTLAEANIHAQDSFSELARAEHAEIAADRAQYAVASLRDLRVARERIDSVRSKLAPAAALAVQRFDRAWSTWSAAAVEEANGLLVAQAAAPTAQQPIDGFASRAFEDANGAIYDAMRAERAIAVAAQRRASASLRDILLSTLTAAVLTLLAGALLFVRIERSITTPLRAIVRVARSFSSGDYSARSGVANAGEIGTLGETFDHTGATLERAIAALERRQAELVRTLASTVEARDPYTANHSLSVAIYARDIACELGHEELADRLYVSGLLHDLGKAVIDSSILNKPGPLDDREFAAMKRHPLVGAEIIARSPSLSEYLPGVRWHHERMDGSGYPDGIAGEQLPLEARILAVADTWNAMTSERPYRPPLAYQRALDELHADASRSRLDPPIVAVFIALLERHGADYAYARADEFLAGEPGETPARAVPRAA